MHSGRSEALFELFDLGFDTAGTNWKASLLKIQIVHTGLVGLKIMSKHGLAVLVQLS